MTDDDKGRARYILNVYRFLSNLIDNEALGEDVAHGYGKTTLFRDLDRLENFMSGDRLRSGNGGLFLATKKMVTRWKKADAA